MADTTSDTKLVDIRESYEYDTNNWDEVHKEGKIDMQFVAGNPWTTDDDAQRKDRPTVAPEEMSQYRNQVVNALMANPRGMKFSPTGNGASQKGAEFYQNKAREIEYRSHAKQSYILAADNALQRSYGFVRVATRYASPRSSNQDLWIDGFPNPDMVLPDSDATRPDSADMQRCFVHQWITQKDFKRKYGTKAKIVNFGDFATTYPRWVKADRVLISEFWQIETRSRVLLLVQPPAPQQPPRALAPAMIPPPPPIEVFKDEYDRASGMTVVRELRKVDYPSVKMYLTNGLEILHEQDWPGKYIPIVSCYGKVLYMDGDAGMERKILSMTRFGRGPWKSYCYACSQELEVLAMVPKAPLGLYEGQMDAKQLNDLAESMHRPKAAITFKAITTATGNQVLPPPSRIDYAAAQHLQALEVVKEGFRRAIQAAMGSNFLPTQAQRRNEKSGIALDKMEQAATQGTYHFVNSYEDMIRQVGVICEDLMDKIYDFRGQVGVMEPDGKASTVHINTPDKPDAINTKGDYLVTVSTAPSSDSEQEAAKDFTDTLVSNIQMIAAIAGPKAAAAVLARSIRMRNLGPQGDQLADLIEPPEYKTKDGQPPPPELLAAQQHIQQLTEVLKRAAQEKQAKVVEQQGKFAIASMQEQAETERAGMDRETKLAVAELSAKVDRLALFLEERARVGAQLHEASQSAHDRAQTSIENAKNRAHERIAADAAHAHALEAGAVAHDQALEAGEQGQAHKLEQGQQAADLAPQPEAGA